MKMKLNVRILLFKMILLTTITFSHSCRKSAETSRLIEIDPRTYLINNFQLSDIADNVGYICLSNDVLVSIIKDLKVINHDIFVQVDDTLLIKYDLYGENPQIIGRYGRGPGEYQYITSFAVDHKTGTIYIVEPIDRIKLYSNSGTFIGNLELKESTGLRINDIEYFNSHLFLAQYNRVRKAEFNWVIADTIGNIITYKKNNIPPFESGQGRWGGIFKFENRISHWDGWSDTIYTVYPDLSYTPSGYFVPGEHRHYDGISTSPQQIIEALSKICNTLKILETADFIIYNFFYLGKNGISFISKTDQSVLSSFNEPSRQGIENDLDNGPGFTPLYYFQKEDEEYLIGWVDAYRLKAHVESQDFQNSTPKYPEKKKELEELAAGLDENDNPVLMLVKLKE